MDQEAQTCSGWIPTAVTHAMQPLELTTHHALAWMRRCHGRSLSLFQLDLRRGGGCDGRLCGRTLETGCMTPHHTTTPYTRPSHSLNYFKCLCFICAPLDIGHLTLNITIFHLVSESYSCIHTPNHTTCHIQPTHQTHN